jgi:peptidoglycan/xylan/chitin deacetylase (PgdA/CDA1 family)
MSPASADACRVFGMTPVYWSAWGLDWERVEAERIAKVAGDQIDDGAIVLLHDSARYARRPTPVPTALAIPLIVEQARQNGISFVSLGAALADPGRVAA